MHLLVATIKLHHEAKSDNSIPFPLSAKVDGISLMQVHPLDPYTLVNVQLSDPPVAEPKPARIPSSVTRRISRRTQQRPAFTTEETRHHFTIEALDKSGPFRPQPYLYTCIRCKWIFRINSTDTVINKPAITSNSRTCFSRGPGSEKRPPPPSPLSQ